MEKFADYLQIFDCDFKKERIGNDFDGGYVIPELNKKAKILLFTYGVADDISFEFEFQKKYINSKIYLFDHTVRNINISNPNISFLSEGLGTENINELKTLDYHLSKFDQPTYEFRVLKLDIESSEVDVLESINQNILAKFDLLIIEFHFFSIKYNLSHTPYFSRVYSNFYNSINSKLKSKIIHVLKKINYDFTLVHAHINNSLGFENFGDENFPVLLECTYIKKTLSQFTKTQSNFPIPTLDFPNKKDRLDYVVDWLV